MVKGENHFLWVVRVPAKHPPTEFPGRVKTAKAESGLAWSRRPNQRLQVLPVPAAHSLFLGLALRFQEHREIGSLLAS